MEGNTSDNSLRSQVTSGEHNDSTPTKALHKYIFFLLTMLGVLLQVKQQQGAAAGNGVGSPYVTNNVTAVMCTVALFLYVGSLATRKMILQSSSIDNSDLGAAQVFMNNMSLLCGTLASILLVLMLVPVLGWLFLVFWTIYFVTVVVKSYQFLKTLYAIAVAALVHAFHKFKNLEFYRSKEEAADQADQINQIA